MGPAPASPESAATGGDDPEGDADHDAGARCEPGPWPQATVPFTEGAFLVLYTDGLIERRNEDIDTGLSRLAAVLTRYHGAGAGPRRPPTPCRRTCCLRRAPMTTRPSSSSRCRSLSARVPRPGRRGPGRGT